MKSPIETVKVWTGRWGLWIGVGGLWPLECALVSVLLGLGNENKSLRILYWELGILDRGIRL